MATSRRTKAREPTETIEIEAGVQGISGEKGVAQCREVCGHDWGEKMGVTEVGQDK